MEKNTIDTTITDKKTYKISTIVDKPKYDKLSDSNKKIFELLRNSILEIFPIEESGIHNFECLRFAENYAFINLESFVKGFEILFDEKIKDFETKIKEYIMTQTAQSKTATINASK